MSAPWAAPLMEALPAGMILIDATGKILSVNRNTESLTHVSASDLEGKNFFTRFESLNGIRDAERLFREGGEKADLPGTARFGTLGGDDEITVRIRIRAFDQDGQRYGVAVIEHADIIAAIRAVRHDVNNSLMGLMGHAELLRGQRDLSDQTRKKVDSISVEINRIREKIARLGDLAAGRIL